MTRTADALLAGFVREGRLALRRLRAGPAYALFSITTLALAIAITTAVYSLLYHSMRLDYGVEEHELVYSLHENSRGSSISWPDFIDITAQQQSFEHLAAWTWFSTNLGTNDYTILAGGGIVSGGYFALVRRTALHGRTLVPADDGPTAPPVVVLTALTARRLFGDEENAIGRVATIAGQPLTVIGVMGENFRGLSAAGSALRVNFWVPLSFAPQLGTALSGFPTSDDATARDHRLLQVFGRLRPEVTMARASEDLRLIGQRLNAAYSPPPAVSEGLVARSWSAAPAFPNRVIPDQTVGRILIGLPALVFLIACTNIANLSLSRGIARRNAVAIRHALGATRARLVREEVCEAVIIVLIGGASGLALASVMLGRIVGYVETRTSLSATAFFPEFSITAPLAASALVATLLAMLIGGLLPAVSLTRRSLRESMASDNDTSRPRWRGRSSLIALQVGVSVGLFLIASSAAQALPKLLLNPGPRLDGLAVATIPFAQQGYDESRTRLLLEQVTGELRRTPGIASVGLVAGLEGRDAALLGSYRRTSVTTPELPFSTLHSGLGVATITGSPEAFALLGLTPLSGRTFSGDDAAGSETVAVINDALARELFGATDVAGHHVQVRISLPWAPVDESSMRIVGVVPSRGVISSGQPRYELYLPLSQDDEPNVIVLAQGSRDLPIEPLRRALRSADPLLATAFIGDGARLGAIERVMIGTATGIGYGLAAFALLLALAGLYGVLSHIVSLRSRELAVRVALGASARRVTAMVLYDGLRPVVAGLLIALGVAMLVGKVLSATVAEGISTSDPAAFAAATILLLLGGFAACLLPARRASRVDPNIVLKEG